MERDAVGIYVHIPFCHSRCKYCSFTSNVDSSSKEISSYMRVLNKELYLYSENVKSCIIDSIFIGGGTPSFIDDKHIENLILSIKSKYNLKNDAEMSIEVNPNSITPEKLKTFKRLGINRLSIGAQSFSEYILNTLGRTHKASDIETVYSMARDSGFENINLDLIFGIPGQCKDVWESSLKKAICLKPEHISFYGLQLEEGTVIYNEYKNEILPEIDEKIFSDMYFSALNLLENAGYKHYEVSNCSLPGYRCLHNSKYWKAYDWIGAGVSSASFFQGYRRVNPTSIEEWTEQVESGFQLLKTEQIEKESNHDIIKSFVMTALRLREGLSLEEFKIRFGIEFFDFYSEEKKEIYELLKENKLNLKSERLIINEKHILESNSITSIFV